MANGRYRGLSTIGQNKKFRLIDYELVKRDLINHFSINKGEKLMNPEFGSLIWKMLYEPLSEDTKAVILADVQTIVNYDPRLRVDSVLLDEFEHGLQVQIDLTFLPGNFVDSLRLEFNSETNNLSVL
jgi:phage baseplate assembly protein W